MDKETEKKLQSRYTELRSLAEQIQQMQQQIQLLENQLADMNATRNSLQDIGKVKSGTDVLVQLNTGIFAKAQIKDPNELIVNVGAGVAVKKDVPSTKKLIEKQIDDIKKVKVNLNEELQSFILRAHSLEQEINKLAE